MASDRVDTWDQVVAFARSLPGVTMERFYGRPCPKVNRKAVASPSHETETSFHVPCPHDEKTVPLETGLDTFWRTPQYKGWPGVLVRYGSGDPERIRSVIRRAWRDRAKKVQREVFGDRP